MSMHTNCQQAVILVEGDIVEARHGECGVVRVRVIVCDSFSSRAGSSVCVYVDCRVLSQQ